MRPSFIISLLCLLLTGCSSLEKEFRPVWTQAKWPPASQSAPEGFKVTPRQAFAIVGKSHARSLKHVWHLYADSRYYYVHDTFLGDSPRRVFKQGVRIDGRTGEIVKHP
jgi:hypothetical protein